MSKPSNYFMKQLLDGSMNLDCNSLIEVIQHMCVETLVNTIDVVFSKIKPKLIIVSTPNNEFNVVFQILNNCKFDHCPSGKYKFRHADHKFEWTRKEFNDWCMALLNKYSEYEIIRLDGLGILTVWLVVFCNYVNCIIIFILKGLPPEDQLNVGFCSQIAVFKRKEVNFNQLKTKGNMGFSKSPFFRSDLFESEEMSDDKKFKIVSYIQYPKFI